jgi:hypothetical protein
MERKKIRKGDGAGLNLHRHPEIQGIQFGLGVGFSLVSWADPSFFSPAPQHIAFIWDIISTQSQGEPDFFASLIFRIMSPKGIPPQQP